MVTLRASSYYLFVPIALVGYRRVVHQTLISELVESTKRIFSVGGGADIYLHRGHVGHQRVTPVVLTSLSDFKAPSTAVESSIYSYIHTTFRLTASKWFIRKICLSEIVFLYRLIVLHYLS